MASRLALAVGDPRPDQLPVARDLAEEWELLVDAGLVGMHLPIGAGGGGSHSGDVALVAEQLGRRCSPVPFLGQAVVAAELALLGGIDEESLTALATGARRMTIALTGDLSGPARVGEPSFAWDSCGATHAITVDGAGRLWTVEVEGAVQHQADLTRQLRRIDSNAEWHAVGQQISGDSFVRWQALVLSSLAADLVGVMQGALDAAVDYVIDRRQFGVPVGTFQAVQHIAADAAVALEGARASTWYAAWAADELDPGPALLAARQAKAYASAAAMEVVEAQTQMLGGIALTWEERAHLRVRRVLLDRVTFGDEAALLDAIAVTRIGAID
jgi:alkylation response protein AidB-like acyl-CoA dehydrogenase